MNSNRKQRQIYIAYESLTNSALPSLIIVKLLVEAYNIYLVSAYELCH